MIIFVVLAIAAAASATGLIYQWLGTRRDRRSLPPPGELIEVDGLTMHVNVAGEGQPVVVFVSGISSSSLNWTALQRRVAACTTAVAYDRPGLGWSGPSRRNLTAAWHARALRDLLRTRGLPPPFVLVAHSFGSYIAQIFADRYEDDVAAVLLVDPIGWEEWVEPGRDARRLIQGATLFGRIGALLAALGIVRLAVRRFRAGAPGVGRAVLGGFGRQAVAAVSRVMGEVGKMPPEVWDAIQAHWSHPRAFLAMARQFAVLPASADEVRAHAASRTRPWSFPLVVLGAEQAPELKVRVQQEIATRSTAGEWIAAAGAGHWIHLDRPDAVMETLTRLIRRGAPGRSSPGS
ncbi:MAG TPA: alpha/beta hydrolase [Vicinamibacterales bacterium]